MPNAAMNVSVGGELGEPELVLGEQRQDGALLADHPADERVDADQQRELREVLPQPQPQPRDGVVIAVVLIGPRPAARPLHAAQVSGPPSSTETSRRPRAVRMLAPVIARSPCPHMTVTGPVGNGDRPKGCRARC